VILGVSLCLNSFKQNETYENDRLFLDLLDLTDDTLRLLLNNRKIFDANVDACFTCLETQGLCPAPSASSANLNAQCITAICILAEQIFTEGSALGAGFSVAFSRALASYSGSQLQWDVNQSITALSWPHLQVAKAAYESQKMFEHWHCNNSYCVTAGWPSEPGVNRQCDDERREHAYEIGEYNSKMEKYQCRLKEITNQMVEIAISNRLRINGSA